MNLRTMGEMRSEEKGKGKKGTESYSGGERSGMAVWNPADDPDGPADPMEALRNQAQAQSQSNGPAPEGAQRITIYADGFTVNGGPLRKLTDPANKKFMDDVMQGYVPEELRGQMDPNSDTPMNIALEDKKSMKYEDAQKSTMSGGQSSMSKPGTFASLSEGATAGPTASGTANVTVNDDKPTTSVQFRFGDGKRQQQTFNEDASVQELFDFVQQVTGAETFTLMDQGGFPPKPITDKSKTIKEAGLCKGAIMVKS